MSPSLFAGGVLTVYFKSKVTILSFFKPGSSSAAPFILREGFLVLGAEFVQTDELHFRAHCILVNQVA